MARFGATLSRHVQQVFALFFVDDDETPTSAATSPAELAPRRESDVDGVTCGSTIPCDAFEGSQELTDLAVLSVERL